MIMTQEQKDILLKDLCARLPYGVKISVDDKVETLDGINILDNVVEYGSFLSSDIEEVKHYLFPLSSMTEEHIFEINDILGEDFEIDKYGITDLIRNRRTSLSYLELDALFEYFNKNHFDYRGLISMDLAIDATNLNIY
jgi:hypothetical protein